MLIRASILSARASKLDCSPIVFWGRRREVERGNDSYTHFMLWLAVLDLLWSLHSLLLVWPCVLRGRGGLVDRYAEVSG